MEENPVDKINDDSRALDVRCAVDGAVTEV